MAESTEKVFMFPDRSSVDPNLLLSQNGGCGANNMWNNPLI